MGSSLTSLYREHMYSWAYHHVVFESPPLPPLTNDYEPQQLWERIDPVMQRKEDIRAILLYCHLPDQSVRTESEALHTLAEEMQDMLLLVWEYPGCGHRRDPKTPRATTHQGYVKATWEQLQQEAIGVLDRVRTVYPLLPVAIMGRGVGSNLALHMVCERPTQVKAVLVHDVWTSWTDFLWGVDWGRHAYRRLALYWWEPRVFDTVEEVQRKLRKDKYQGHLFFSYNRFDVDMPVMTVYKQLVQPLMEEFGEDQVKWLCSPVYKPWTDVVIQYYYPKLRQWLDLVPPPVVSSSSNNRPQ